MGFVLCFVLLSSFEFESHCVRVEFMSNGLGLCHIHSMDLVDYFGIFDELVPNDSEAETMIFRGGLVAEKL